MIKTMMNILMLLTTSIICIFVFWILSLMAVNIINKPKCLIFGYPRSNTDIYFNTVCIKKIGSDVTAINLSDMEKKK